MTDNRKQRSRKEAAGMNAGAVSHRCQRPSSNEAGQVLVIVALSIFVLIGTVALAVDVGFLRYMKRNMQKAADSGAIAGALERIYDVGNIQFAARRDTSKNGFTHNEDGVIVTVNNPPLSGPHRNLPDRDHYVEVIIDQDQPTFFAKIFNISSARVVARAVAYGGTDESTQAEGCIFTLDPTGNASFHVSGENTFVNADCAIYVNSNSNQCASRISGNSTVHSTGISVVGASCIEGSRTDVDPTPETGATPVSDPLAGLLTPPTGFSTSCPPERTNVNIQTNRTLNPGVYCGGIRISRSNLTVNFNSGLYILYGGGLDMHSGNATLRGHGVTFYNTGSGTSGQTGYGSMIINANAGTELFATPRLSEAGDGNPPSIPGILFWQDPNNTKDAVLNGQSDTHLEGALYYPSADITFNGGNSTQTGYAVVVAQQVKFTGSASFTISNASSGGGSGGGTGDDDAVIPRVVLVE